MYAISVMLWKLAPAAPLIQLLKEFQRLLPVTMQLTRSLWRSNSFVYVGRYSWLSYRDHLGPDQICILTAGLATPLAGAFFDSGLCVHACRVPALEHYQILLR